MSFSPGQPMHPSERAQLTTHSWGRALLLALLVQAGSFLLYSPALWNPPALRFTEQFAPLAENPWRTDIAFDPQVRHRILGPVIAHYLGLRGLWAAIPAVAANTLFLAVCYQILLRFAISQLSLLLLTLLATTQTVVSTQTWIGYQDSFGHLAIACCLYFRNAWLCIPLIVLGMLGDERCATALPWVVLWHFALAADHRWRRSVIWAVAGFLAIAIWWTIFRWVQGALVPETAKAALNWKEVVAVRYLAINLNYIPLGAYEAFRAAWILPLLLIPVLVRQRLWLVLFGFLTALTICILQASLVADISRCSSFGWPALMLSVYYLSQHSPQRLARAVRFALLLNIFTPSYQIIGGQPLRPPQLYWPFPLALLRLLLGW
jgi:hypothetical protein